MLPHRPIVLLPLAGILVTVAPCSWALQSIPSPSPELRRSLAEALVDSAYGVGRESDAAAWQAPNPAQGMCSTFAPGGVCVTVEEGGSHWSLTFALAAWGRPGAMQLAEPAEPSARGRRVEYGHGGLTEWYVNCERGLEQGFTVDTRPAGAGPLEIELRIGGGVEGKIEPGRRDAQFVDRATASVLHYSGLRAWDAGQLELEASLELEGRRLWIRVDDADAVYPVLIDPWIATEEAKLIAGDGAPSDLFGVSVSLWADTAVVGASGSDPLSFQSAGAAYVFVRNGTTWTEQAKLTASDGGPFDRFGTSVSAWGDTAVVGAPADTNASGSQAGAAYVFVRNGTTWVEQAKLTASNAAPEAWLGQSVSVSGDSILVGAYVDDGPGGYNAGSAYVFVRNGTAWTQQAKLLPSDPETGDWFGESVSLSGDTALVGARYHDTPDGVDVGAAYVFVRTGSVWTEQQGLVASDPTPGANFGVSVALSDDTAVVGAFKADNTGGIHAGAAYVFSRSGAIWSEEAILIPSGTQDDGWFGRSVAVADGTALIGAWPGDHFAGNVQGEAYYFVRSGSTWTEQAKLTASDGASGDYFGGSVAIFDDRAIVGASDDDNANGAAAGAAYVFRLSPGPALSYCTPGTSASGCQALLSSLGTPSAKAPSGFSVLAGGVEGSKDGMYFWGKSGKQVNPWGNGTSFQCVVPPLTRGGLLAGAGTNGACDGAFAQDLNAVWCPTCPYPQKNPGVGSVFQVQLWYRDPQSTSNQSTSLSNALEAGVGP